MTDNFNLKIGDPVRIKYLYDNAILNNKVGIIKNIYTGETSEKDILEVIIKVNDTDEVISINKEYVSSRHLVGFEHRVILAGLYRYGYRYIAKDRDGFVNAFASLPHKDDFNKKWYSSNCKRTYKPQMLTDNLGKFCFWEDDEPESIAKLIGISKY